MEFYTVYVGQTRNIGPTINFWLNGLDTARFGICLKST